MRLLAVTVAFQSSFSYEGSRALQDLIFQASRFVQEHIVVIIAAFVGAGLLLMYLRD